jgi:hypothetical protein
MTQIRRSQVAALALVVMVQVAACGRAPTDTSRGAAAWSERLTQQAESISQDAARREQARDAWSQRLTEQADQYFQDRERAERANRAWSARLNLAAERYAAGD